MTFFLIVLVVAWLLAFIRTLIGPTLIDRAAAADMMTAVTASILVLVGLAQDSGRYFMDVAILLVAGGFLGAIFFAKMHERGL